MTTQMPFSDEMRRTECLVILDFQQSKILKPYQKPCTWKACALFDLTLYALVSLKRI